MLKKVKDFVLKFISKDNFTKTKLIIAVILAGIMAILFEYKVYSLIDPFPSKNRIIFLAIAIMVVLIHFIIKLDKMYGYLYKYRYIVACAFLLFVMVGQYSGSSITNYNYYIEPKHDTGRYHTLLGIARLARSDEWASSTDYILSQGVGSNTFNYFSNKLRGTETDMFTLVNAPVFDILMLGKPFQLGFLLFGNSRGLSFYWYVRLVAMILGSFELCMIVTNKNKKISLLGSIMISFSAAVQWWYCLDNLIWAQIILVLFNLFFVTEKRWVKYASAFGLLVSLLSYLFWLYPAWQVSFAYFMLGMLVWIIIKNWKNYKINLHDLIVILVTIICFILLVFRWATLSGDTINTVMNTAYPGNRLELGGSTDRMFTYIYNIFTSFDECINACEYSSMLSFFPIPMILGIFYLIRNRKKENAIFLIPMLVIAIFMTAWCFLGFPEWLAKITLMNNAPDDRATLALGTINIYILIFLIGRIQKEDKWMHWGIGIVLGALATWFTIVQAIAAKPSPTEEYFVGVKVVISSILFGSLFILIFNMNKEKCQNVFLYLTIFTALASGIAVNPIIRTTDIIYEKPIAKKMAEIREKNPDAVWLGEAVDFQVSNYMVANGLRTISSTSVYPNVKFFEELLGEGAETVEYNYNRYAHNVAFLTDAESSITLQSADYMLWYINYNDLKKFNVKYILSTRDINELEYDIEFEKIYSLDNLYIFEVK